MSTKELRSLWWALTKLVFFITFTESEKYTTRSLDNFIRIFDVVVYRNKPENY